MRSKFFDFESDDGIDESVGISDDDEELLEELDWVVFEEKVLLGSLSIEFENDDCE